MIYFSLRRCLCTGKEVTGGTVETDLNFKTLFGTIKVDLWNGKPLETVLKDFGLSTPIDETSGKTVDTEFELPSIVHNYKF